MAYYQCHVVYIKQVVKFANTSDRESKRDGDLIAIQNIQFEFRQDLRQLWLLSMGRQMYFYYLEWLFVYNQNKAGNLQITTSQFYYL